MELFFMPLACSMASRIALYEAGASATFTEVDPVTKRTREGLDYREIYPLGLVPTLRLESGELLIENAAVLQYLAARFPEAGLAPRDALGAARLQQWLSFIGTEIHKAVFKPLLDKTAPEEVKAYALENAPPRFEFLERHLAGREFLLDTFSVADAYLVTVLGWSAVTPVELEKWPVLAAYAARLSERPSVARARAEEAKLRAERLARHRAA
jgi:glutathione S-transferase